MFLSACILKMRYEKRRLNGIAYLNGVLIVMTRPEGRLLLKRTAAVGGRRDTERAFEEIGKRQRVVSD